LELLLDKKVDIDEKNYLGETALMQAAGRGNVEAVKWLLEKKAKWKLTNK
jgi:ankyrin repeat protein